MHASTRSVFPSPFRLAVALFWAGLAAGTAGADGVRPQRFGPFLQQSLIAQGNPSGYDRIYPFGAYNLQAGWMEPIAALPWPVVRGSYLETQANATAPPYQADFVTGRAACSEGG